MNHFSSALFRAIREGYTNAYAAYMAGDMTQDEFFNVKKVFASAQQHLMPSKGKAMREIEKDLAKKYGDSYKTV
mgnify:CR=1 FL=1